ncbi:hypothetical protein OG874_26750 [Nocardia sp. NBC_00565]|uniref:DUF2231 domain-containing protein n=1 Tax=Nocardia sp. NBC_00565 TaxID=2975993 RepID=UPI002E7FD15B|nr:DUF2231 domain-containing protein [Nocardia sp. NBC_00565]WUC00472.1 hypothetical protein OG874_26750 [Nocardia sp. NBC_00565]
MSMINGLPAHVLLVHIIVVFVPLTAVLLIMAALWPAARRRLIWLITALAAITVALTPITTDAGEWLEHKLGGSPAIDKHADLGNTMIYFVVGLLLVTAMLIVVHLRAERGKPLGRAITALVAALAILAGGAALVQVYRVGDSGSHAVWGAQAP